MVENVDKEVENVDKEMALVESLRGKFGDGIKEQEVKPKRIKISTSREMIKDVARAVKDLGFEQVIAAGGTDYPKDNIYSLVYYAISVSKEELRPIMFAIMITLPKDDASTPTLIDVWKSAEYHEQETFENLGIIFEGHPRMEKLLLPEDWDDIPPLRKDFVLPGR